VNNLILRIIISANGILENTERIDLPYMGIAETLTCIKKNEQISNENININSNYSFINLYDF